jgi:hypothetical protein
MEEEREPPYNVETHVPKRKTVPPAKPPWGLGRGQVLKRSGLLSCKELLDIMAKEAAEYLAPGSKIV